MPATTHGGRRASGYCRPRAYRSVRTLRPERSAPPAAEPAAGRGLPARGRLALRSSRRSRPGPTRRRALRSARSECGLRVHARAAGQGPPAARTVRARARRGCRGCRSGGQARRAVRRAPVIGDVELAIALLGFDGGASDDFVKARSALVHEAGHDYRRRRAIVDSVPDALLRSKPGPAEIDAWRTTIPAPAASG